MYLTIEIVGNANGKLVIKERTSAQHWDEPCLCEPLTSKQIVDHWTSELEDWQKGANIAYIDSVWAVLKPNGIWGYPEAREAFKRVEDHKWILQGYEDVHNDVRTTLHVEGIRITSHDGSVKLLEELA